MSHGLLPSLNAQQNSSEMSETQWPHTHTKSHLTSQNWSIRFPKPEGPVWAEFKLQRLVQEKSDHPIFQTR
jgi:hypothetical protein